MASSRNEFFGRGWPGKDDLEAFRERILEPPDDALSGDNLDNSSTSHNSNSNTNNFNGVGRTGTLILGILSGLSIGLSVMAIIIMSMRDQDWRDRVNHVEKRLELTNYYLMDPHSRTPDELAAWTKFNLERESVAKQAEQKGAK